MRSTIDALVHIGNGSFHTGWLLIFVSGGHNLKVLSSQNFEQ